MQVNHIIFSPSIPRNITLQENTSFRELDGSRD